VTIELSAIDRERFGFVTARALADEEADVARCDAFCSANGVALLIVRCPTTAIATVHAFEDAGGRLMDCMVRYRRDLRKHPLENPAGLDWIREARPEDAEAIAGVAARAFSGYEGHYHADRRLRREDAAETYRDWAVRSSADQNVAERIFVACDGDTVAGFVTLRRNSEAEMEAVLLAIAPEAQGSGVPYAMGVKALRWAADAGARRLIVSTQVNNVAMQRALVRHRFEVASSDFTIHKWYDSASG
jgi:ribosomal protein S18 acetylase RimI-like enzyme